MDQWGDAHRGDALHPGALRSPDANDAFIGQDACADVTDHLQGNRFPVQWVRQPGGLIVIINPVPSPQRQRRLVCRLLR